MTFFVRGARQGELDQILEQLELSFREHRDLNFTPQLYHHPGVKPEHTRLGFQNEVLAASVQMFIKQVYIRGKKVPFAGIANVGTLPEYRGRGFIEAVLKDAICYMRENEGVLLSGLYTGVHEVYRPHGFENWPQKDVIISLNQNPGRLKKYKVRPYENKDLSTIIKLYDSCNRNLTGPVVRNREYWTGQLKWMHRKDPIFQVLTDEKGSIKGYFRGGMNPIKTNAWVREIAGPNGDPLFWKEMAWAITSTYNQMNYQGKLALPGVFLKHPLTKAFKENNNTYTTRNNKGLMLNIIQLEGLLKLILDGTPVGPDSISLTIQTPKGKATLESVKDQITVNHREGKYLLNLPQAAVVEWVLGRKSFSQLPAYYEEIEIQHIPETWVKLLDELLPVVSWNYMYTDSY